MTRLKLRHTDFWFYIVATAIVCFGLGILATLYFSNSSSEASSCSLGAGFIESNRILVDSSSVVGVGSRCPAPATFDDLLDAIEWVESKGDTEAVGDYLYFDTWEDANEWRNSHGGLNGNRIYMDCKYEPNCPNLEIYIPQAIGAYQIHKIYVDDVRRIAKLHGGKGTYPYMWRWDKEASRLMVTAYIFHYAAELRLGHKPTFEDMARIHNGGPTGWKIESTKAYWLKVKERLESLR